MRRLLGRGFNSLAAPPSLLDQALQHFSGRSVKLLVDCTLGAGDHALEIIRSHPELETFVGLDLDPVAIEYASQKLNAFSGNAKLQLQFVHSNFKHIKLTLNELDPGLLVRGVDGILMDLGASTIQMNNPERGFNYYLNGPLDMRMDQTNKGCMTTGVIVNCWNKREIGRVLRYFGEMQEWKTLGDRIVQFRYANRHVYSTTRDFARVLRGTENRAAVAFQALRIAVNDEFKSLRIGIPQAASCLAPGGLLAVFSHLPSEEKIVKHQLQVLDSEDFHSRYKLVATSHDEMDQARLHLLERLSDEEQRETISVSQTDM